MIDEKLFKRVERRIHSYRKDMIELQTALCAAPAIGPENGGEGEFLKAKLLEERLVKFGFPKIFRFDAPDDRVPSKIRPNLVVKINGRKPQFVWIITHLDIVPPGELNLWSDSPYKAYVKKGKIFGRGVEDNQQDMVASIFAARAILDEGITPHYSIGLGFVADEETSGKKGLYHLVNSPNNPIGRRDMIVIPDSGNPQGTLIEITEKSMLWLKFKTTGKQCHGSNPHLGKNAFVAASHLVTELSQLKKFFPKTDRLFDPPQSTFEPTKKESNVENINTIPGEDVFYMDCRVLPCYRLTDVMKAIKRIAGKIEKRFGVRVEITPVHYLQAPKATPADAPVVRALEEAIAKVYGVKPFAGGVGAGTLAAYLRRQNYQAAVWSKTLQTAHQPDEHCSVADIIENAKVFAYLFLRE
ncbi:MAG TPA: M20 family metallo-hydrolase [Smithella sp.]|nr:M20 family metallo-hydrolase [Smithella sp.]